MAADSQDTPSERRAPDGRTWTWDSLRTQPFTATRWEWRAERYGPHLPPDSDVHRSRRNDLFGAGQNETRVDGCAELIRTSIRAGQRGFAAGHAAIDDLRRGMRMASRRRAPAARSFGGADANSPWEPAMTEWVAPRPASRRVRRCG